MGEKQIPSIADNRPRLKAVELINPSSKCFGSSQKVFNQDVQTVLEYDTQGRGVWIAYQGKRGLCPWSNLAGVSEA